MATLAELESGLVKADAAGNADDAKAFADAIRTMRVDKPPEVSTTNPDGRMAEVAGGLVSGGANLAAFIQNAAVNAPSRIPGVGLVFNIAKETLNKMGMGPKEVSPQQIKQWLGERGLPVAGINIEPSDTAGRYIVRISEEVGASLIPGAKVGMAANVGTSVLSGAGAQAMKDAGGPEIVGQLLGGLAPAAATGVTRGLARGVGETADQFRTAVDDAAISGTNISLGQATTGWRQAVSAGLENVFGKLPGGGHILSKFAKGQSDDIGTRLDEMANKVSRRSGVEVAGGVLQKGVENFVSRFKKTGGQLYDDMAKAIPNDSNVLVDNYRRVLDEVGTPIPGAAAQSEVLGSKQISALRQALIDDTNASVGKATPNTLTGAMPFETVRALRSRIGARLTSTDLMSDIPRSELKRIYGALTDDMEVAAKQHGPKAEAAFSRANKYWKAGIQRIDDVLENISKRANPEDAYTAVMNRSRIGSSTIRAMRRSLEPQEWDVFVSNFMRRLGTAPATAQGVAGDTFFATRMLTDWNNMSPKAKNAMFGGTRYAQLSKDMDAIARTAERIKEGPALLANPHQAAGAGTNLLAGTIFVGSAIGGLPALAAATAGVAVTSGVSAKLMTNPKFVRWLARGTRIVKPQDIPAHIGRLSNTMKSEDDETQSAVKDYLNTIQKDFSASQ